MDAPLVVGFGDPWRGDDGVGPAVVREVAALAPPVVEVAIPGDPVDLLDRWAGRRVVVVDAVRGGAPAGSLRELVLVQDGTVTPAAAELSEGGRRSSRGGTHALGLVSVLGLAAAIARLPERLVLVGVVVASLDLGRPLSPAVSAALPRAVRAVLDEVRPRYRGPGHGGSGDRPDPDDAART